MAKNKTDATDVPNGPDKTLGEVGEGKGIEKAQETDILTEAFMNDILTVVVWEDNRPGSNPVVVPNVNGTNQPIIRGLRQKIKRKYVEILARSRITNYEQETPDPSKPENITMKDITALTYPFSVEHDPHPDGRVWLQSILDQPA